MPIYCIKCRSNEVQEIVEENRVFYLCPHCQTKSGKAFIVDSKVKIINTSRGIKHISVAGLIINDDKVLLTNRRTYPFGLELPVGHLEHNETLEETVQREVYEEIGLKVEAVTLLAQLEQPVSYCRYGSDIEDWVVFSVDSKVGQGFVSNNEVESIVWLPLNGLEHADLTPSTRFVLAELGYLSKVKEKV